MGRAGTGCKRCGKPSTYPLHCTYTYLNGAGRNWVLTMWQAQSLRPLPSPVPTPCPLSGQVTTPTAQPSPYTMPTVQPSPGIHCPAQSLHHAYCPAQSLRKLPSP